MKYYIIIIVVLCVFIFTTKTALGSLIINTTAADSLESDNLLATLVLSKSLNVPGGKNSSDGILTSIPVNIFKRSDEDARSIVDSSNRSNNGDIPKKKPKLYSWWMPNMTMTNSGQSVSTTEISVESSTILNSSSTRPTRKPRPTRPPRTRRPSKSTSTTRQPLDSNEYTSTPGTSAATVINPPSSTASSQPISDRVSSSTEPSTSYVDPYGVKRKLVHVAKAVGKVAVKTIGVVGSVAVGTAVKSVGSHVAPIASNAVSKASSVALSAATQVGSYAVDAAGRALIRFAASLTNSTGDDSIVRNEKSGEIHLPTNSYQKSSADGSRDEGKIVTVYVKRTNYMGGQAMNEDESRKKNHTVYHLEDRVLMESRVQDLEEMMADSPSPPDDETPEKGVTGRVDLPPPTVPAGVKKVFNKKNDSKISNTVCRNKPGILITTMNSLVLGILTTILKNVI